MKITWLGHAAFLIETMNEHGHVRIITDPYSSRCGYEPIHEAADVVTLSHENPKYHSCLDELRGEPYIVRGLEMGEEIIETHGLRIGAVPVFESYDFDKDKGEGPNMMMLIESEGLRVLHMGDVGHGLGYHFMRAVDEVDILLAPTGGPPTIHLEDLKDFIDRLQPSAVLPMHYGTSKVDMRILPVDAFITLFPPEQIQHLSSPTVELTKDALQHTGSQPMIYILPHAR